MGVIVTKGKHTDVMPDGLGILIEDWLRDAGFDVATTVWKVHMGVATKGTPHTPRRRVKKVTTRGSVQVYVKPGCNSTARYCFVYPPRGFDVTYLSDALRRAQDHTAP